MTDETSSTRDALVSRLPSGRNAILAGVVALLLLGWLAHWVWYRWAHVHVDDARIDGEVVTMSSRVSGWITELAVIEGDVVKAGQVIARIDDRDSKLRLDSLAARLKTVEGQMAALKAPVGQVDQETLGRFESETNRHAAAEAEVKSLEFQVKQAKDDYQRAQDLHNQRWLSQQAMERARTTYQQVQENHRKAVSEVAAAKGVLAAAGGSRKQIQVLQNQYTVLIQQANEIRAEMRRQEIDIADRTLTAPADGRIVMTFVRRGEHVTAGQRMLMFHDPANIWVEANVKETEIRLLEPGMKAEIRVDAYPGRVFEAKVFRIGQAATSKFALLPDPNPSGNFTKITQRLPVRLMLADTDAVLRPGMMVEVDVAVR